MSNQEFEFSNMVNKHADESKRAREEAYKKSQSSTEIKYGKQKKKRNKINLKIAITSIALSGTIALSAGALGSYITSTYIENHNAVISTSIAKNKIDEKIENYKNKMDMYADKNNSIETNLGIMEYDGTYQARVDYTQDNIENLAKHISEASKISEEETRCVIIAAYNIINTPYIDKVIGNALNEASQNQDENTKYKIPATTQQFLETLGYTDWESYQKNERKNIVYLYAASEYVQNINRKGL